MAVAIPICRTDLTLVDIVHLQAWVGRTETMSDTITAGQTDTLAATLDLPGPITIGQALPPLWHWIFFLPRNRQADLGYDGHPKLGGFMPPVPLPRRMWAGGRLTFHDALLVGDVVERTSRIESVEYKRGQSGDLVFVTVQHTLFTSRGIAILEEQDLVYREPSAPIANTRSTPAKSEQQGTPAIATAQWRDRANPDARMLFRYSAATFNTHRIHYDLPYAQSVEGYPGLVVQGPLTATLLATQLGAHASGTLKSFEFRGHTPLFADATFHLCGRPTEVPQTFKLWAESPDGSVAMTANAKLGAPV